MLSKKLLKDIQTLGLKKGREEAGLFVAEGPKLVNELLQAAPSLVEAIYATTDWQGADSPLVHRISTSDLERISQLKTPNQVLALMRPFESRPPSRGGLQLYLDAIQDPGNFGTIIRIADWFGIADVVCSTGCADLYNPKVVQSTMASLARVNVFYDEAGDWLAQQPSAVYAAALNGKPLQAVGKLTEGVLVIGNESKGIRPAILEQASTIITIPKRGGAESLNAAVATGIILSHLVP